MYIVGLNMLTKKSSFNRRLVLIVFSLFYWSKGFSAPTNIAVDTFPYGIPTLTPTVCTQGIQARFFGTTTIAFNDGKNTLLTDGFFSRPNPFKLLFLPFSSDEKRITQGLAAGNITTIDALLVSHSHHDHAMDSGLVAQKTGAMVYGSRSVAQIVKGQNFPMDRFRIIQDGDSAKFGDFKVTFYETPHSGKVHNTQGIDHPLHPPATLHDYKLDKNYSFYIEHGTNTMLIVPSGNYTPGKFSQIKADVVFLGVGGMRHQPDEFIETYWNEVVKSTGAKKVILIHWDNFTKPLTQQLTPLPAWANNTPHLFKMIKQLADRDGIKVALMPIALPITVTCQTGFDIKPTTAAAAI